MLIRIVRMEFEESKIDEFLHIFSEVRPHIEVFEGCEQVELKRDAALTHVFYTHSIWQNESALEAYRVSDFFRETWSRTKKLFSGKPAAFSLVDL